MAAADLLLKVWGSCHRPRPRAALKGPNRSTPLGSVRLFAKLPVGGGHKKRALAHGY